MALHRLHHSSSFIAPIMSRTLLLNCWVLCDDTSRVFLIKVLETETIGSLKDLIKEKKQHRFKDVDADSLDLWQVGVPADENLAGAVQALGR